MTTPSPFAALETTFRLLGAEPFPVAVDGQQLGYGLPCRQIPVTELRCLLTQPSASDQLHDRVIEAVLERIPQQRATRVAVLGGLVLPGLRCQAGYLAASKHEPGFAVEAALLWQLAGALRRGPRDVHHLARELLQLAQACRARGGQTGCRQAGWPG